MDYAPDSTTIDADIAPELKKLHDERYLHLDKNGRKYLNATGSANNSDLAGTHCVASVFELPQGIRTLGSSTILSKYTLNLKGNSKGASTIDCYPVPAGQYAIRLQHDNTPLLTLGNNPLSVTAGSPTMTIDYGLTPHGLSVGNNVVIAGASTFASLSSGTINKRHNVASIVSPTVLTVTLDSNAGGTGVQTGGGNAVTAISNLTGNDTSFVQLSLGNNPLSIASGNTALTITFALSHGFVAGSDIQLIGAPSIGGIAASVLNTYHRITSVTSTTVTVTLPVAASENALGSGGTGIIARGNFLERFRHLTTRFAIDGIRFVGNGRRGCHGIALGNDTDAGSGDNRSTRGLMLNNTEWHNFDVGITRPEHDNYLQACYNTTVSACRIGIDDGSSPTATNRGERMTWFNTTIYETEGYSINYDAPQVHDHFIGSSLDFSERGFVRFGANAGYQTVTFSHSWFESHDDIPFRSDAIGQTVNHTILTLRDSFWLGRQKTVPSWSWYDGSLSVTGGARAPMATGFQTLQLDGLVISNEARFSDPAGVWLADENVRVIDGNVIFLGFNGGFTQQLKSESLVRNYNHDFSASDVSLAGWTDAGVPGSNVAFSLETTSAVTLGADPISTQSGSMEVVIAHNSHTFRRGDKILIAGIPNPNPGITNIGGILVNLLNRRHTIIAVTTNTYTIKVAVLATSSASGGGNAVTSKKANVMLAQANSSGGFGVILSDFFPVTPGEMWNTNFKVDTAAGSTGLCNVTLSYLWYTQGDVLINDLNDALVVASNTASTTALGGAEDDEADGMYARINDPAYTAGSRARPVQGLGGYRQAPRWAAKARIRFECNNFAANDPVRFAFVATNKMSG
jgi:hypothetical protein